MRSLFGIAFVGLAAFVMAGPAVASEVEVKGPHICCKQCVKAVGGILSKVDGVSDAKCDIKGKTVTFTATDEKAAKAGVKALFDGGFFGAVTNDGKELKLDVGGAKKGDKVDKVTVKGVHACCGQCNKAIKGLFKDSTVTIEGEGAQRTIVIEGGELYRGTVLQALRKAGFNGNVEK
jgi:copper chaperone CopZ